MHGLVFAELKKFVEHKLGPQAWSALLQDAKLGNKAYFSIQDYPDSDAVALVAAASRKTGLPADAILEMFGEFITPALMRMYGHLAKPSWHTLEFIENAERSIHTVVRINNPGAKPPELRVSRVGANEVVLHYASARKMCALAKGIAKGVAAHYAESLTLKET
jgi:hypothetical protein